MKSLIIPTAPDAVPNVECAKCGVMRHIPVIVGSLDLQLCWRCENKKCNEVNITSIREDEGKWETKCRSCGVAICSRRLFDLPLAVKEHDDLCLGCCFIGWLIERNKERILKLNEERKAKKGKESKPIIITEAIN